MNGHPPSKRWSILVLLSIAEMMAISVWLISSAISKDLAELWQLSDSQSGALATAVQLGFVAGTLIAAIFNLADIIPNRYYFAASAIFAATANGLLLACNGFVLAFALRFLVGFFLAGVYPPAMKMIATWFQTSRGFAIGTLIGALTLGKAAPFLIKTIPDISWQSVVGVSSIICALAGILVLVLYREGPFPFARRPFSLALVGSVLKNQKTRLAIGGYLGHMWELYAMWTWIYLFLSAAAENFDLKSKSLVDITTFAVIGAGSIGCIIGGFVADRFGRENMVNFAMLISGLCCVVIGLFFNVSFALVALIAIVWGFFVVADSAQFSTMVTEVAPQHAVGTALTLQTSLGFLLTIITIQLIPILEQAIGWRYAFAILGLGPIAGIASIFKFTRLRA